MPFTYSTLPTSGDELTASKLAALINELRPLRVVATSNLTKNNDVTLADIPGMSLAVAASQSYQLYGRILVTGANTTHDVKIGLSLPASATVEWSCYAHAIGSTATPDTIDTGNTSGLFHSRGSVVGTLTYRIEGLITVSTTAGNVKIQGAQNTLNVSDCVFLAGSYFELKIL